MSDPAEDIEIWLDTHLSRKLCAWVRQEFGVGCSHLSGLGLRVAEDPVIFAAACGANIVLMTKDSDFIDILARRGPPPRILWLTFGNTSNAELKGVLSARPPEALGLLRFGESLVQIDQVGPTAA